MLKKNLIFIFVAILVTTAYFSCDDNNADPEEICYNGIDDDEDGKVDCDDPDCFENPHCTGEGETNCTDGIDNDGNGLTDCEDPDCTEACNAEQCEEKWVFWKSPEVCPEGKVCAFTGVEYETDCLDEEQFSGGEYYGSCGANGECPKGSTCLDGAFYNEMGPRCMPVCDENSPYSDTCPGDGVCSFHVGGLEYNRQVIPDYFNYFGEYRFCEVIDECDPVNNSGCSAGEACYIIDAKYPHTKCLPEGNELENCDYLNGCVAGYACTDIGCEKICNLQDNTGCPEGYYCGFMAEFYKPNSIYGICTDWGI